MIRLITAVFALSSCTSLVGCTDEGSPSQSVEIEAHVVKGLRITDLDVDPFIDPLDTIICDKN